MIFIFLDKINYNIDINENNLLKLKMIIKEMAI